MNDYFSLRGFLKKKTTLNPEPEIAIVYEDGAFIEPLLNKGLARFGTIENWSEACGYHKNSLSSVFAKARKHNSFEGAASIKVLSNVLKSVHATIWFKFEDH